MASALPDSAARKMRQIHGFRDVAAILLQEDS